MIPDAFGSLNIILASASPRRRQLLSDAGLSFSAVTIDYDETWPPLIDGREVAEYLAEAKADHWPDMPGESDILITADTVVWCQGMFLGKPAGEQEALQFLRILSGRSHDVITGICLKDKKRKHVFSVTTTVTFRPLEEEEILYYVKHFRPYDKAGAYGIQEWIGLRGITTINGSYYNVVGMPVSELLTELKSFTESK